MADRNESEPRVEYVIEGGPELDHGIHEIETSLRIRLDAGEAFLEQHQPSSAQGGEPLGTFKGPLPPELLSHLRTALSNDAVWSPASATAGGPGSSLIRVRMSSGGDAHEVQVSSRDVDALEKLDPLLAVLNDAVTETMVHPFQAVRFGIRFRAAADGHPTVFAISVTNVGKETVVLPDLTVFGGDAEHHDDRDLNLSVAPYPAERPGYTAPPLVWKRLGFAVAGAAPALSLLAPGQVVSREGIAWTPSHAGERHLAQAGFAFYGGPPVFEGHLVIKGRALSEAIEVTSPK